MLKRIILTVLLLSAFGAFAATQTSSSNLQFPAVGPEKPSPADRISYDQISVSNDKVSINVKDAIIVGIANTNSMDPLIDENSEVIEITPKSPDEIHVGDIISYQDGPNIIIHRVLEVGFDAEGWFAKLKGDNNPEPDPNKVRWQQVKRMVVGILY